MEWLFELLDVVGTLVSRLSARGMLIALAAVMAFVAVVAVVITR